MGHTASRRSEMYRVKQGRLPDVAVATHREDELLICCARVTQSPALRERFDQLLQGPIDWQTVLNRSWWHRIRPLAHRHLAAQPAGVVPAAVKEALASQARELRERNERLAKMLDYVAVLFEELSLPMLVFKGPTLATDAYGDLALRECGDLDMLVRKDDFPQVREFLVSHGFECLWDQEDSGRKRQLFACEFRRDGVELDIHWDLAPHWHNYAIDFEQWWAAGNALRSDLQFARKLRPEDSLEVLCMHGTRHWWERLRWICDIAELVNSGRIADWDRVEAQACQANCHRSVWLGLWLACDLLDAKLPLEVRHRLEQSTVVRRLGEQVGGWLMNSERAGDSRKLPQRFLFRMRLCDRWRDRIPQLARYVATMPSRSLNWNP